MNKILSVYNNNVDVFHITSPSENEIKHHFGWNIEFLKMLLTISNTSKEIRLEIIPTAPGPYFAQERKTINSYPVEIVSKKSNLIGYKQDSKTGSSTILNKAELNDLKNLLNDKNYTPNKNSPLQKLLVQNIENCNTNSRLHMILSSKDYIVGIRVFMENTNVELIVPFLKKTIQI